jgi:CBS domain-containing protein
MGTLGYKEILKGIEPKIIEPDAGTQTDKANNSEIIPIWDSLFCESSKERAEKPVDDIMVPVQFFVDPNDTITKAAYLMLRHDLALLPVLEGNKKFVGLVRMVDIFDEISEAVIK